MSEEGVPRTPEELEEELFMQDWIECGFNSTKAYHKRHPEVTKQSAAVMGHRLLKRVNIPEMLAAYGLGHDVYLKKLKEGLEASQTSNVYSPKKKKFVKEKTPDFRTRRDYHKALGKALEVEKDKVDVTSDGKPISVNVINYAAEKPGNDPVPV